MRNWIGLVFHPFKTLRALLREQDISQIILVIGFPLYWIVLGLGMIWVGRRIVDAPPGVWGVFTKSGLGVVFLIASSSVMYLGYWLWQVLGIHKKYESRVREHKS